jgi:type VI secretion system protein ImpF
VSGSRGRPGAGPPVRAKLPLLDRLADDAPDAPHDEPMSVAEGLVRLRRSVQRDLEALLNARRRWRSWPLRFSELATSPLAYGIPDFAAGALNEAGQRDAIRREIETTIRRFEPRLANVGVTLLDEPDALSATLRLRIDGMLRLAPAPEPIAFDTVVESTTASVRLRALDDV